MDHKLSNFIDGHKFRWLCYSKTKSHSDPSCHYQPKNNNNNNNIYPGSPLALAVFSGALQIKNEIKNKIA